MDFSKIISDLNEEKKAFQLKVQKVLTDSVKHIFTSVPKLKGITFFAYAPYFNDGDECIYEIINVNFITFEPEENSYEDSVYEEYANTTTIVTDEFLSQPNVFEDDAKILSELVDFLKDNEDILKEVIGNHVRVTITNKGIITEEYDHE